MKKIKIFFMLCFFGMISIAANATVYSGSCGDNAKWSLDTATGLLSITGSGKMTDYLYDNCSLRAPWNEYCNDITSLSIGDQITSIGDYAFYSCLGLTSVTIPNSVTSIGKSAFSGCSGLTSVTIPNSVTSIGSSAFDSCLGLTSVTIPNSVTSIGGSTFYGCSGLTSVTIPNSVTSIGSSAFYSCSGLISVTIPNSVTSIDYQAFYGCSGLTSVTIPNYVTSIGDYAFYSCKGLASVTIGNSVTSIGEKSFSYCSSLESIFVEAGNTVYDSRGNCNAIIETASNTLISGCMNTTIPNSVTSIGDYAFWFCSGLTSVTIPNSVTSIGDEAFYLCSRLKSVTIPNSVTSIGSGIFDGCSGLTSVTIGNSVTSIGDRAFENCKGLTSVTIPNSVTSIGKSAFSDCDGLTSMTIPNSVTSIGDRAFENCLGLASVTIGNSVTSIGVYAFFYCKGLTSVTIGSSVTSIGNKAFTYCDKIAKIEFNSNCQTTHFSVLSSLKEVIIGDSVTMLCASFSKCRNLTKLTLGKSLQNIRAEIFSGCSSLKEVHSRAETPPYLYPNVFKDVPFASATLYVPVSAKTAYAEADIWKNFGTIVSETPDPIYQQLSITASKYGKVLFNGNEITAATWNGKIEQGDNLTFTFVPNAGCFLQKVTMNGMDVTKYIVDNVFTIEGVESDVTLIVTFEKEDLTLTVKTSEGVEKEIAVEPGQQFTFNLSAYIDNIESVTFNGEDVTSDIETKTESIPVWQLVNNDIDKCSYQLYTTPAITESSELYIKYKVNHPKGDTNEDGVVDVADITATAGIILNNAKQEQEIGE